MQIKQFEDKNLSHFSYAILSDCEKKIILVDPARNPQPYLDFAKNHDAQVVGVIETHPHADFVSSHLEFNKLAGATIYASKDVDAKYPHQAFDDGQTIEMGKIKLSALNTPGHSPDSISIVLEQDGKQKAVFTGDTLFIGDCGRPDLREGAGNIKVTRSELAKQMYHSLRKKLMPLNDDVIIYPAHGAGTLCGKNLSSETSSTMGEQKQTNWSLQPQTEEEFVNNLLSDQPFVPAYFPYDVELNRNGAPAFDASNKAVKQSTAAAVMDSIYIIDVRPEDEYKKGYHSHSINLMLNGKFETWLGSIIKPGEKFYLAAKNEAQLQEAIERCAVIGYEANIEGAFISEGGNKIQDELDVEAFKNHKADYTILDIRNEPEVKAGKIFANAISIPLAELRSRTNEIPTDKPVVVHCAGGYRSAAGSSLLQSKLNGRVKVFDLSEDIKQFS